MQLSSMFGVARRHNCDEAVALVVVRFCEVRVACVIAFGRVEVEVVNVDISGAKCAQAAKAGPTIRDLIQMLVVVVV